MSIGAYIKEHPVEIGGVALVGMIIVYLLLRSSGGSSSSTGNNVSTVAAADEQENQVEAASSAQADQSDAAVQTAQVQANAQTAQATAAEDAANEQTDAALVAALAQNQTQAQQYTDETSVDNTQTNAELDGLENTNATNLSATALADGLQTTALNDSFQLAGSQQEDTAEETDQVLGIITPGFVNHGIESQDNVTGILDTLFGNAGGSEAAENANLGTEEAGDFSGASDFNSVIRGLTGSSSNQPSALSQLLAAL